MVKSFDYGSIYRLCKWRWVHVVCRCTDSLPNVKILDFSKLKAFADIIINVAEMMTSLSDSVENIVGKGENTGYQHLLLTHNVFKKLLSQGR